MKINEFKIPCSLIYSLVNIKDPAPLTQEEVKEFFDLLLEQNKHPLTMTGAGIVQNAVKKSLMSIQRSVPATAKALLSKYYAMEMYGKTGLIDSKSVVNSLLKGEQAESDAIKLLSQIDNRQYEKNEQKFQNSYIKGVPDIIMHDGKHKRVIDIKCPVDMPSFIYKANELKNPEYDWQMQGYLWLTKSEYGEIAYCLVNTPQSIINKAKAALIRNAELSGALSDETYELAAMLDESLKYDDIPLNKRIIRYKVTFDKDKVEKIKRAVELAREWLRTIHDHFGK